MHLTQDILKCQHCLDFKIYILGTILINAYLIHRLTKKKIMIYYYIRGSFS